MTVPQPIPRSLPDASDDPPSPHEAPRAPAVTADVTRVTPMMEQYLEIKAANPGLLLFYRMGDFYELFFEDAEIASRALGIVLTKRGKHAGDDIPMCGVPVERSEDYLHRLIARGHRVAVCEQTENPAEAKKRGPKSVVRRDVVRHVTPGTLTEETLLDARANNYLLALARSRASATGADRMGLAWIDMSTSEFIVTECAADRTRRHHRPHQSDRSDRRRRAVRRRDARPTAARTGVGDAADARRVRQRHRRAAIDRLLRGRDHGGVRHAVAAGGDRGRRLRDLYRAHAGRQTPAAGAALARSRRHHHGDRSGHPRQSRTHPHVVGRAARLAAGGAGLHRDRGRLKAAGAAAGSTARPIPARSRGGSMQSRPSPRMPPRARTCEKSCTRRPTWRARWPACRSDAAARATWQALPRALPPPTTCWRGWTAWPRRHRRSPARLRRCAGRRAHSHRNFPARSQMSCR